jgi:hypothetical protein
MPANTSGNGSNSAPNRTASNALPTLTQCLTDSDAIQKKHNNVQSVLFNGPAQVSAWLEMTRAAGAYSTNRSNRTLPTNNTGLAFYTMYKKQRRM